MSTEQDPRGPRPGEEQTTAHGRSFPLQEHDVLIFPKQSVTDATGADCYRIPVTKAREATASCPAGSFVQGPQLRMLEDPGIRKALNFMHPDRLDPKEGGMSRGPAFAVAPVKAEPVPSSFVTCYMINTEYFAEPNLWTLEEWNDAPGGVDYGSRPHPEEVEALIAVPWGEVLRLRVRRPGATASSGASRTSPPGESVLLLEARTGVPTQEVEVSRVDLQQASEVWQQLRNGCIAGRAKVGSGSTAKVLPLVNITALMPLPPEK